MNAPEMTTRDAARLTFALMTGAPPTRIVETYKINLKFRNDEFEVIEEESVIQLLGFKQENTAEDFLVNLIDFMCSNPPNADEISSFDKMTYAVVEKPAYVIFKAAGLEVYFTGGHLPEMENLEHEIDHTSWSSPGFAGLFEMEGMHVRREISDGEIEAIASGFRTK